MRVVFRLHWVLGVLVTGLLAAPAAGQMCDECSYVAGVHKFSGEVCVQNVPGCFDCRSAPDGHIGCHAASITGECGPSGHGECGQVIGFVENELLDAIRDANAAKVAAILASNPSARLNPARGALQIKGCTGAVVSHIGLSKEFVRSIIAMENYSRPLPTLAGDAFSERPRGLIALH